MVQSQQGFEYEKNAAKILKEYGIVPKNFTPAGASHNQPDLMLEHGDEQAGCELKITAASAGSLVLKYDARNKLNPWGFNNIPPGNDEKLFIKNLAQSTGVLDIIKKTWKGVPLKREKDSTWDKDHKKIKDPKEKYQKDLANFPEISGEIDPAQIEKYYNKKDTWYVNIGTHGFFLLGAKNPLSLKNIPRFSDAARAKYRARVQYKGGGNYQFTFEMSFSMRSKSPYNIAPITGNGNVVIQKKALSLSPFGVE